MRSCGASFTEGLRRIIHDCTPRQLQAPMARGEARMHVIWQRHSLGTELQSIPVGQRVCQLFNVTDIH
jgi:hypothetical protein